MWLTRGRVVWLLLLLLLLPLTGGATEPPAPEEAAPSPAPPARRWYYLTRLEATTLALLPRAGVGAEEGFAQIEPLLIIDGGPEFGANVGAPVRLRLWGGSGGAGLVRREDWDSLSDWGQLVRALKLGSDSSPVALWVGALEGFHLLSGQLVRRYSNRSNPDYHPAGALFTAKLAPLYVEVFASDVLGARLMGAEVELDAQHVLFGTPRQKGRYTLALSAVQDWGRAGGRAPPLTLAHLDATAVVLVRRGFELHLVGMGQPGARYLVSGEARWRFTGGKLYAMRQGGTLLFPTADGALRPGAFASVGLGVDHAR